jgi:hypothetical protein
VRGRKREEEKKRDEGIGGRKKRKREETRGVSGKSDTRVIRSRKRIAGIIVG